MRRFVLRSLVVFLPFACFMTWSSVAQGCAHGDESDVAAKKTDTGTDTRKEAALFPTDPGTDEPDTQSGDHVSDTDVIVADVSDAGFAAWGVDAAPDSFITKTPLDSDLPFNQDASCRIPVSFSYVGPVTLGSIWIEAWWQPPSAPPRPWGVITECPDPIPGDGSLECLFSLPCGTTSLEFQVYLSGIKYWGDESATGGNGSPIGTVSLFTTSGNLPYVMIPNPKGSPYMNGFVASVY
jgi:hypothetical protein